MSRTRIALGLVVAIALVSCGAERADDPEVTDVVTTTTPGPAASADPVTSAPTAPVTAASDAATTPATPTTDAATDAPPAVALAQAAVWPAPGVVFATPEEAAADFVSTVFGVEPVLGPYRAGDQRSGEIDVLFAGEGDGGEPQVNSGLSVRRLPPDDGWFVLFGVAEAVSITSPASGASVDAGPVTVEGVGRGFEGTLVASAFPAGDASSVLDTEIARGGPFARPEPYSVTVDLTGAPSDRPVALLVRGDTGADGDTGEFSVIPITVTHTLPEMR
jgi:hypothetical protein